MRQLTAPAARDHLPAPAPLPPPGPPRCGLVPAASEQRRHSVKGTDGVKLLGLPPPANPSSQAPSAALTALQEGRGSGSSGAFARGTSPDPSLLGENPGGSVIPTSRHCKRRLRHLQNLSTFLFLLSYNFPFKKRGKKKRKEHIFAHAARRTVQCEVTARPAPRQNQSRGRFARSHSAI